MPNHNKDKQEIFLLSKLRTIDYLIILGAIVLLGLVMFLIPRVLNTIGELDSALESYSVAPRLVPARSIQATHNTFQLWHKDDFYVANVTSRGSLFFTPDEQSLVYPAVYRYEGTYTHILEAVDIITGQARWQTNIAQPAVIRIYDNNFVVLASEWLDQAPAIGDQELPYCSFGEKRYSLSTYDIRTGHKNWGYGYRGVNLDTMYFVGQNIYLEGSHDHGNHEFLVSIDVNSGQIAYQRCNGQNPARPRNAGGTSGPAFGINSIDAQEIRGCSTDSRYCFVTDGNRLIILAGSSKEHAASVEFGGSQLTAPDIDVVVQGNIAVVHLLDSHQLYAFRLP